MADLSTLLQSVEVADVTIDKSGNPTEDRRNVFVTALQDQIAVANDPEFSKAREVYRKVQAVKRTETPIMDEDGKPMYNEDGEPMSQVTETPKTDRNGKPVWVLNENGNPVHRKTVETYKPDTWFTQDGNRKIVTFRYGSRKLHAGNLLNAATGKKDHKGENLILPADKGTKIYVGICEALIEAAQSGNLDGVLSEAATRGMDKAA